MLAAPFHTGCRTFPINRAAALQDIVFRVCGVELLNVILDRTERRNGILDRTERRNGLTVEGEHEGFEFATDVRVTYPSSPISRIVQPTTLRIPAVRFASPNPCKCGYRERVVFGSRH